jgi:hypothetical protein
MTELGRYDPDLEMFVEEAKPVKTNRLLFERWLVQNGKGEHFPMGRPVGDFALGLVIKEDLPIEDALRSVYRKARDGKGKVD